MNTITNRNLFLTINSLIAIFLFSLTSIGKCHEISGSMINNKNTAITLRFALTKEEHLNGLSGIKPNAFKSNEGMLFVNKELAPRKFWMPDTYFNLDIIFLDSNLLIVGIEKNVKAHPGTKEPPVIQRTGTYSAQFILETKANSLFSKNLKVGNTLTLKSKTTLAEIVLKTHHEQ